MRRWWASWRVALRLARRDAMRARGRAALVAVLIGLPLVLTAALDVVARSHEVTAEDARAHLLGDAAQAWVAVPVLGGPVAFALRGDGLSTAVLSGATGGTARELDAALAAVLPPGDRVVPLTGAGQARVRGGGRVGVLGVGELDYRDLPGVLPQVAGRAPAAPGEAVISADVAHLNGLRPGAVLTLDGAGGRALRIVGLYRSRPIGWAFLPPPLVVFPGTLPAAGLAAPPASSSPLATEGRWVIGPDPVTTAQVEALARRGAVTISRHGPLAVGPAPFAGAPPSRGLGDGVVLAVVIALLVLQIVLMAGPAMAVGARRHEQSLALVAACGGDRRQVRRHVLAGAVPAGLAGSVAGTALGVLVGALTVRLSADADAVPATVRVPWLDLAVLVVAGTAIAVAAALLPARQASRLDVVAVLGGRPGAERPRLRVPVIGLVAAVTGAGVALWAGRAGNSAGLALGIGVGEVGLVAATGAAVAVAARVATRLPLVPRLALRDAARHRSRTAPAVAAVMAALAGGVAILLTTASSAELSSAMAADGVVSANVPDLDGGSLVDDWSAAGESLRAALPARAVAPVLHTRARGVAPEPVPVVGSPSRCGDGQSPDPCDPAFQASRKMLLFPTYGWVDDGHALDVVTGGADPGAVQALRSGRSVVWDPDVLGADGTVRIDLGDTVTPVPGYLATGPVWLHGVVLSTAAARQLDLRTSQTGLVLATTRQPTAGEEARAEAAFTEGAHLFSGLGTVEVQPVWSARPGWDPSVVAPAAVAALVALAGVLAAVALVAAEGRADRATLAAVGGPPSLRRKLAAAQAAVVAGFGAVLGTVGGGLAGWALIELSRAESSGHGSTARYVFYVPWLPLTMLILGVPVVAVLVAAASTRAELVLVRRRGA